ncbi:MAG: c-type cytochrome [Alphaproteobacteria bacterium]
MRTFLAVVIFSLLTVGFFAGYSNYGIPQIEPAPPPEEEVLDLAAMTMDEFVALGGRLYEGRGTCTLCHNEVGGRAPLLEEAAAIAAERLADARYQGEADDTESYLYESMVDPSAYVVAGFGKSGTGDTVSPMPNMMTGRVGLNEAEIRSVVAFLQDLGGFEVTVEIPTEAVEDEPEEAGEPRPPFATPEEAIAEFACGACHKVAGEEGELGPDLTSVGARREKDDLRRSILRPNADIAEGFEADMMPDDYGEQLYAVELEMLVDYLAGLK